MTTKHIRGLLWLIVFTFFTAAYGWAEIVSTTLFEPGAMSSFVQGQINDSPRTYTFHLDKGQALEVRLLKSEGPIGITLNDPAGESLLPKHVDPYSVKACDLIAPRTGVYNLVLSAPQTTGFRLSVSLPE